MIPLQILVNPTLMHKKRCLLHANCQGDELAILLRASSSFDREYELSVRTNYTADPIADQELSRCDVFLYQHLGRDWGALASDNLCLRLSPSALALQIPNLFFKGYWPFWTSEGPIDFGDSLLNRLIDEGAPKPAILRLYLKSDITRYADLAAALEETVSREREKEAGACVGTVDHVLARWKKEMVFHTVNHPDKSLLVHVAQGVLRAMGLPPLRDEELPSGEALFPSYADFDLPIHPRVAAFHGLDFGGPEQTYRIFSRRMTFEQYVSRYIDCRLNKMEKEFLGYLQLV